MPKIMVEVTPQVRRCLEQLMLGGLHGSSIPEVAERLVSDALMTKRHLLDPDPFRPVKLREKRPRRPRRARR